jgi:hypothetical protein
MNIPSKESICVVYFFVFTEDIANVNPVHKCRYHIQQLLVMILLLVFAKV